MQKDVDAVVEYRKCCVPVTNKTLIIYFPFLTEESAQEVISWIDFDRDFIYTDYGLRTLINRYLKDKEPIQVGMLRIALILIDHKNTNNTDDWKMFYDLLSCGFIHTSSILAYADNVDSSNNDLDIKPGEACRLIVADENYDITTLNQINAVCNLVSTGVGVGFGCDKLPLHSSNDVGKIRSGFTAVMQKLDSCNYLSLQTRKPKIAVYIYVFNDTLKISLDFKMPSKQKSFDNVFIGVMIPNYFMYCVANDLEWCFFPGNVKINGQYLSDVHDDDFKNLYLEGVKQKLYSYSTKAMTVLNDIISSLLMSGSPYLIFSDNVNAFNNQQHAGPIKTLNLCAEITNYASPKESSSCTLLSVNMAMIGDFSSVFEKIVESLIKRNALDIDSEIKGFKHVEIARFAYCLGYLSTLALNRVLENRDRRELGITPLGVYDMAMICGVDPIFVASTISEALYKGSIRASCDYFALTKLTCKYYNGSHFERGHPQWWLRNKKEKLQSNWSNIVASMTRGMSNSMLTAQAPTATTSLLIGVTESITIPSGICMTRESDNGRAGLMVYGLMAKLLSGHGLGSNGNDEFVIKNDIDTQIAMYSVCLPFIDHSQATMFTLPLDRQNVFDLISEAYRLKFKTAIYYISFKQNAPTLKLVNYNYGQNRASSLSSVVSTEIVCNKRTLDCVDCSM